MLIYDENAPSNAIKTVEDLLEKFAQVLPDSIERTAADGRETRYSLKASDKDSLSNILAEAAQHVSPAVIPKILRRFARDRFSDWILADETETSSSDWTDSHVVWRGGLRRGRLFWNFADRPGEAHLMPENADYLDWEVIISSAPTASENTGVPKVFWKPAPLRKDEAETILRYHVLLTDASLKEQYGEQIHAAGHAHTIAVERIWNRMFIEEADFVIEQFDYNFTEEARAAQNLSDLFAIMLEPLFETRYPEHPIFAETLGMTEVSALVNDLFSGARANLPEIQKLAETFALPLGLVTQHGATLVVEREENLAALPQSQKILALVRASGEETVSLKTVYHKLKQSPAGLVREAQHLILTALVAQRQIEFVTSKGDRINRRSLDLKIIWDDIEGIAKPAGIIYGNQRLTEWARILTGSDALRSIDTPDDSAEVIKALETWLAEWQTTHILERFNRLPDEILNTKIWRIATQAGKTFGVVAATVGTILDEAVSLDEGLHRIADAFSDSEREFFARTKDLVVLEDFINGIAQREEFLTYLTVCETTDDEKIEYFREKLLQLFDASYANPSETYNREIENLWQTFSARFVEYFAVKHDLVMKSHHLQEKFDDILRSDEWWEFENLSRFSVFPDSRWKEAQHICRQLRDLDCRFDVREMLKTHPFCACSFSLQQIREWEKMPQKLEEAIHQGRNVYRRALLMLGDALIPLVLQFAEQNKSEQFSGAVAHLIEALRGDGQIPLLTNEELIILQKVFEQNAFSPISDDVLIQATLV